MSSDAERFLVHLEVMLKVFDTLKLEPPVSLETFGLWVKAQVSVASEDAVKASLFEGWRGGRFEPAVPVAGTTEVRADGAVLRHYDVRSAYPEEDEEDDTADPSVPVPDVPPEPTLLERIEAEAEQTLAGLLAFYGEPDVDAQLRDGFISGLMGSLGRIRNLIRAARGGQ